MAYYALKPDIKVIAPWREWDLNSRSKLIEYAEKNGIPVPMVGPIALHFVALFPSLSLSLSLSLPSSLSGAY